MNQHADSSPPWASRLRNEARLTSDLDLEWLSPDQQHAVREDWLAVWNQVPFDDAFHAQCRERLARSVPLVRGLTRERRLSHTRSQLVLVHDPEEPDTLFANLSHAMPSMLWVQAKPESKALLESLSPYLVEQPPAVVDLPRVVRVVKALGVEDRGVIERSIEHLELWVDDAGWASAHDDDP